MPPRWPLSPLALISSAVAIASSRLIETSSSPSSPSASMPPTPSKPSSSSMSSTRCPFLLEDCWRLSNYSEAPSILLLPPRLGIIWASFSSWPSASMFSSYWASSLLSSPSPSCWPEPSIACGSVFVFIMQEISFASWRRLMQCSGLPLTIWSPRIWLKS